ncbi:glycosyltransferase family 4 protein [Saccharothrix longispora]|uniref:Glycosyltransferase involved in cell wall biosynthesis n=1 Tax=Saccharothrix longispora TaxID=33920 RepID=A0ABU1Q3H9_9PSEU|nr:glycosyltransferase [Saccharothrix longispora]MDR6597458.1 glycosyltransferase involved in cell wall biosynthesis [Saccharothrix longispora]
MADTLRTTACTVVSRAGLPAASVLVGSYLEHHPGHDFVVLLIDEEPAGESIPGARLVGPRWLDVDRTDYLRMAAAYLRAELAGAVKPLLLRQLLGEADVVLFLAPEIRVYAPLPDVAESAARHDIVLASRFSEPLPRDGKEPNEVGMMASGMFDLGFLAVSRNAKRFLDFWAERLRQDSVIAPEAHMHADQRWVDQVPALFQHTVLRDAGSDVGYWNLHERPLERHADGSFTAGGEPLRFFHFAGYRPDVPWLLSTHCQQQPRVLLSENPDLGLLTGAYGEELVRAGYVAPEDEPPYRFDEMADGTPLTTPIRRMFRNAWIEAERPDAEQLLFRRAVTEVPPHPFGQDGGEGFREWLSAPSSPPERAAGLNRLCMLVWAHRPDLQAAFPWPCGENAADFRTWCHTFGVSEGLVPEWARPAEPAPVEAPVDRFGVNLAGYLTAELGLGEMGRIVHDAIRDAGVPLVSVVEEHSLSCRSDLDQPETAGRPRFPVSVMAVNADQTELLLASYPEVGHQRYRIGLWAWELEELPRWQREGFAHVDEIWTVSEFCREAFARHSPVPVKVIPVPVKDPGPVRRTGRVPGKPVQFFFAFDFNSIGQRKNPWGLVEAFRRAFPDRDDVRLVIKATNSRLHARSAERLRVLIADDPRIELMERYLSVADLNQLYADSDAYVSLHRSEGFGLTVAEAMVRGMPVIATDYSSTTEFFDSSVGWPIPYRMVEVGPGWYPYQTDAKWADPDVDEAARAMREVADNPEEAERRGAAAREHILRTRSAKAAADWMRARLTEAYRSWQQRGATPPPPAEQRPPAPGSLSRAREALRWRADSDAPSRLPLAPALRKAVLRAIDHYDVHQRKIMAEIVDGTANAVDQLTAKLGAQDSRIDSVQAETTRRVAHLAAQVGKLEQAVAQLSHRESPVSGERSATDVIVPPNTEVLGEQH